MKPPTGEAYSRFNHSNSGAARMWLALATTAAIGFAPMAGLHAQNGTINGSSVTMNIGDDSITSATIGINYFTYCPWVPTAVSNDNFTAYNFVFAGQGVASGIANIAASDFTVNNYAPWVGNNNSTSNNLTGPDGQNYNRNIVNGENGGANLLMTYKPTAASDPTNINFLQVYVLSFSGNGGAFSFTSVDNGGMGGPFYNENGAGGVGNVASNSIPLRTSSSKPGWLLDIPNIPEWGYDPAHRADDTITNASDYFQTFISSQQNIGGTNYNVLYGGIQWGFTFNTVDVVPEPTSLALAGGFGVAALCWRRYLRRRG
jgi:hypothetical protein